MPRRCTVCDHPERHSIDEALVRAVKMPVAVETRTLTGRRRLSVEKLTNRLKAPVQGTGADGLKLALTWLWESRSDTQEPSLYLSATTRWSSSATHNGQRTRGGGWKEPWLRVWVTS
jgi:hypothetical protein